MSRTQALPTRCVAVWCLATLLAGVLVGGCAPDLVEAVAVAPPAAADVAGWLVLGCEAVALPVVGWLWVLVSLLTLDVARSAAGPRRGVPAWLGRLVLAACGAGLVGSLASPAHAVPGPPSPLAGLPLPDRAGSHVLPRPPAEPSAPRRAADVPRADPGPGSVRVAPGDSLWELAATELPAGATAAAIDRQWRAVHAANREVIGDDPDLIFPGQRLRLPPDPARPTT